MVQVFGVIGRILIGYVKYYFVFFGEYVLFCGWLFIEWFMVGLGDFMFGLGL